MNRGDAVFVQLCGGARAERLVWDVSEARIAVCTVEAYKRWERYGEPPLTLGFSLRYVEAV